MKSNMKKFILPALLTGFLYSVQSIAAGMVPETSLLIINEADEGGSINIKNTDADAALLYTSIIDLPDDKGTTLIVTQPVVRVDGGKTQHVRFLLTHSEPLKVEHLKRALFEGIPSKSPGANKIGFNIRQDIPVLIHPANLPIVKDAWTLLEWSVSGNSVKVKNPSPYVVRLAQQAELLPSHTALELNKTYLLPGQEMTISTKTTVTGNTQVKFYPASRYGIQVGSFTANIGSH